MGPIFYGYVIRFFKYTINIVLTNLNQIFISYEWGKKEVVNEIANNLEKKTNHKIWIHDNSMIPGDILHERIQDGINRSQIVLAFLTPAYFESHNCQLEIKYANRLKKKIIYTVLEKLNVGALPNGMGVLLAENLCFHAYDPKWTNQNMEHYIRKLIEAVQNIENDKSMFVYLLRMSYFLYF